MFNRMKSFVITVLMLHFIALSLPVFADDKECGFQQVTNRIHVIVGSDHKTCPKKDIEHPLTNPSVIVGDAGVILIDPGSSLQTGRLVLERIRTLTDKPVVAVFNSHIHGLYWLGNQAVKEKFPDAPIYAHQRMIDRIKGGEGPFWVEAITGKYSGEKTKYILPDISLSGGEVLRIAGITLKIHHTGHAHTDHDVLIEVPVEDALFLGGIVVEPEVPSQGVPQDANFKKQIAATQYAIDLGVKTYIPGRGQPGGIDLPERALRFLETLYAGVESYYEDDLSDFEITERLKTDLSEYMQWYDFTLLGGVISQMYLQIENASF